MIEFVAAKHHNISV
jgi:hypothetical protein